jgi:Protein of unknown function (DUF2851)
VIKPLQIQILLISLLKKMQERLLQFVWQEMYFSKNSLQTVAGEQLQILSPGKINTQQGPDFEQAKILLDGVLWAGNIEVHSKSSQWFQHRHNSDPNYQTVILHVVWEDDATELSRVLPTLVLENRVPSIMLTRYAALMQQQNTIACHDQLLIVPAAGWQGWMQQLLHMRLHRKSLAVLDLFEASKNNWEECCWWWLARQFGGPVNAEFFESVARTIPVKILQRHRHQVIQLEAILLGQGNLLQAPSSDPYIQLLQREYGFLRQKYQFNIVHGQAQFLRMRPAGFPTVRMAQLAMFLHQTPQLFSALLDLKNLSQLELWLSITANDFWHYHYTLQEATPYHPKHMGKETVQQIIINGIVPLVYAVGIRQQQPYYQQLAMNWLYGMPQEDNITQRNWKREGISAKNAAESQALTELKKNFCDARRCLSCTIGKTILNGGYHS